jgi:hypothetical protein
VVEETTSGGDALIGGKQSRLTPIESHPGMLQHGAAPVLGTYALIFHLTNLQGTSAFTLHVKFGPHRKPDSSAHNDRSLIFKLVMRLAGTHAGQHQA